MSQVFPRNVLYVYPKTTSQMDFIGEIFTVASENITEQHQSESFKMN